VPQFNKNQVADIFKQFGIEPSSAELGMFEGLDFIGGGNAIATYVNAKTEQAKQEANNPLTQFLAEEKTRRTDFETRANDLYTQLQNTINSAPKLFGNLTPEQIDQYIAPITQAAKEGSANLEGDFARRNLAGSSIEANALTDANRKYNETVLNTGLNLGLQTQQASANAIQQRINQLMSSSGQSSSLLAGGASQLSDQSFKNMQDITQLPNFLRAQAQQALLFSQQQNERGPSLWDNIDRGINTTNSLFTLGKNAAASAGQLSGAPSPESFGAV